MAVLLTARMLNICSKLLLDATSIAILPAMEEMAAKPCLHNTSNSNSSIQSKALQQWKPLSSIAFPREFPSFTNICGYMWLKYWLDQEYVKNGYLVLHSNDARYVL